MFGGVPAVAFDPGSGLSVGLCEAASGHSTAIPIISVTAVLAVVALVFAIGRWVGGVNEHRSSVVAFMAEMRGQLERILERLPSTAVSSGSPLRLTSLGRQISDAIGVSDWAAAAAEELRERAEGKRPYEVQEMCVQYVEEKVVLDAELLTKVRECAYESGITVQQVFEVFVVELRDKLLGTHAVG